MRDQLSATIAFIFIVTSILAGLAVPVAVGYVAVHFILKFW